MIIRSVVDYLKMIRFSHSIFALPFAFASALIASKGLPGGREIIWITVAMVAARSGAMGLNRIIDRRIDAQNPRTSMRELPSGKISAASAMAFSVVSLAVMVLAAYMLNPLCFKLSPVAIGVLVLYSYTKRFTWASHIVLGIAISAAPLGAWMAVTGGFDPRILALTLAVVTWLAGFDVLYALQDMDFDRTHGLYSIPARFGVGRSLMISRGFHVIAWGLLVANGVLFHLGAWYMAGMALVAGLLIYEHSLVKSDDLSKLNMAFFNMNGYISVAVLAFTFMDVVV